MEQKLFETLIAPYATKVENVVPTYLITKCFRIRKIEIHGYTNKDISDKVIRKGKIPNKVITPDGMFDSVKEAAKFYKRSNPWVYTRIQTGEFKNVRQE